MTGPASAPLAATPAVPRRLLSKPEAAAFLGISPRTLGNVLAAGRIPVVRVSPGRVLLDLRDLELFVERNKSGAAR